MIRIRTHGFIYVLGFLFLAVSGCRTPSNNSEQKELKLPNDQNFSKESWVSSCETELKNPQSGAQSKADLKELAGTEDCAEAFPVVQKIVQEFMSKKPKGHAQ